MGYTWAFTVAARLLFVKFDRSDQSKEEIQIDEGTRLTEDKTLPQVMEILGVVRAMKNAGIELRFGRDPEVLRSWAQGNGMRPPLPGNLNGPYGDILRSSHVDNFFLED